MIDQGGILSTPPDRYTNAFYARSQEIDEYQILDAPDIDINQLGEQQLGEMQIKVFDPVNDYTELMSRIFDFDLIRKPWMQDQLL